MKRSVFFTTAVLAAAALCSCSTTEKLGYNNSTATGIDAIPKEALAEAYKLDLEESLVTANFANAHNAPWSVAKGEYYVQNGDISVRLLKGSANVTQKSAVLLEDSEDDKIIAANLKLDEDDSVNTISFDISDNGINPQNISQSIIRVRMYIPMELAYNNDDSFNGIINFQVTDVNGNVARLEGILKDVSFQDFGTGWKTVTINLGHQTFYLGRKTGTFDVSNASPFNRAKSFDITVQGKSVGSNLDVPVLIDWIDFASLPER